MYCSAGSAFSRSPHLQHTFLAEERVRNSTAQVSLWLCLLLELLPCSCYSIFSSGQHIKLKYGNNIAKVHQESSYTDKLALIDFFAYAEFIKKLKIMTSAMPLKFKKSWEQVSPKMTDLRLLKKKPLGVVCVSCSHALFLENYSSKLFSKTNVKM